jgi:hypothetical protein
MSGSIMIMEETMAMAGIMAIGIMTGAEDMTGIMIMIIAGMMAATIMEDTVTGGIITATTGQ